MPSSDSKVGPLIVKPPPPLPKPRRIPEPVQRELPELKPSKILSHKRALQAVTALAITVGILLLAIIVSVVVMLKRNSKGRPNCVKIYAETIFLLNTYQYLRTHQACFLSVNISMCILP